MPSFLINQGIWVIIMSHGGNFTIAVFSREGKVIFNTSDHKYVIRKKQGGR